MSYAVCVCTPHGSVDPACPIHGLRLGTATVVGRYDSAIEKNKLHNEFSRLQARVAELEDARAVAETWKQAITDVAVLHWVLSEDNANDPRKMLDDIYRQILTEVNDPEISRIAAKAALADEFAAAITLVDAGGDNAIAFTPADPMFYVNWKRRYDAL